MLCFWRKAIKQMNKNPVMFTTYENMSHRQRLILMFNMHTALIQLATMTAICFGLRWSRLPQEAETNLKWLSRLIVQSLSLPLV